MSECEFPPSDDSDGPYCSQPSGGGEQSRHSQKERKSSEEMLRCGAFAEFWPFYVSQHLSRPNRVMHFIGTTLALIVMADWLMDTLWSLHGTTILDAVLIYIAPVIFVWHLLAAIVCAYLFAWIGHIFFEKNKPATFRYPLWSLMGDFKMYRLILQRQMTEELVAAKVLQVMGAVTNCSWSEVYPYHAKVLATAKKAARGDAYAIAEMRDLLKVFEDE